MSKNDIQMSNSDMVHKEFGNYKEIWENDASLL